MKVCRLSPPLKHIENASVVRKTSCPFFTLRAFQMQYLNIKHRPARFPSFSRFQPYKSLICTTNIHRCTEVNSRSCSVILALLVAVGKQLASHCALCVLPSNSNFWLTLSSPVRSTFPLFLLASLLPPFHLSYPNLQC